jgi:hypothetical protein
LYLEMQIMLMGAVLAGMIEAGKWQADDVAANDQ